MWLIIQTNTYKEKEISEQLHKVKGFKEYFLPLYRLETISNGIKKVFFSPLITHLVFLKLEIPEFKMVHNRAKYLHGVFNNSGYLLYQEKETIDGVRQTVQRKLDARLMCVNDTEKNIEERIKDAIIPDSEIDSLKLFVDQMNSTMTEYSVVDDNYDLLESTQDTVMFTEGPYKGFQGIVKQKTVKRDRSRYFYLRVANWTFCIPNARTGRYIVIREATHGKKAKEVKTWTNVDLLIGRFQALSKTEGLTEDQAKTLADDSAHLLRLLLLNLGKKKSIEDYVLETASDTKLKDKPNEQLLLLFLTGNKNPMEAKAAEKKEATKKEEINQKDIRPTLTAKEASALISLNRYYLSTKNMMDYVLSSYIPDTTLRPFLTPTPGVEIKENEDYATLKHGDFTEYIIKVELSPLTSHPSPLTNFYAHIGEKDGTYFVNWGDFTRKCQESATEEFMADLNKKGLTTLAQLLENPTYTYYEDKKNHIHGFSWKEDNPTTNREILSPLLSSAVEVWQSTRLLNLRNLLRRHVLLHSDPIMDQLVPINSDIEKLLYDDNGKPLQLPEENPKLMEYAAKIENALNQSTQYNNISYAVILYHQLLASINGYIEAALEAKAITSLPKLDKICTRAHNALKSFKEQLDNKSGQTEQEAAKQKEQKEQKKKQKEEFNKAMTQNAPTIEYIRKSPSYINTGIPLCTGNVKMLYSNP